MQLNVREVARLLNVSEKTIYRWLDGGSIPAYKVNEQYRFNRAELLEWATSRKINVSADIFAEPEATPVPVPGLAESLDTGGIYYRVGGADKDSVLKAIVRLMHLPDEVDREFLHRVLLAREAMQSTGIGDGIAIPHVRNPIVLHVPRPMITLCFLEKPVDFAALDGKPVGCLFTLVSPTVRAHLHLLSRLAFALRDPAVKDVLVRQGSRDEILSEVSRVEGRLRTPAPGTTPEGPGESVRSGLPSEVPEGRGD
jgi:nitrogen PTS system EIIA component